MKKYFFLFFIITLILISSCNKEEIPDFQNDWEEDIYYFGKNLKEEHYDLFFQYSEADFDKSINHLRDSSTSFSKAEIIVEFQKILVKVGDSHTSMELGNHLTFIPFRVELLDDGVFLTEADISHSQYLGQKVIGFNGIPVSTVLDSLKSIIVYDNESYFKNLAAIYLRVLDFHNYFFQDSGTAELTINLENEIDISINREVTDFISIVDNNPPLFLKNKTDYYWFEELTADNLIYVQYNRCREKTNLSFKSFTDQIIDEIEANTNIKKVVLDLRHNGGGDSAIAKHLINALEDLVDDGRIDPTNIYLIIGRQTFSSAILNALELKEKVNPVFIGEPTGGKPNHYGELENFSLPNSRIKIWYSTKYFERSPNDEDTIEPDVNVEYNSEHLINSIDPVLEWIKND